MKFIKIVSPVKTVQLFNLLHLNFGMHIPLTVL